MKDITEEKKTTLDKKSLIYQHIIGIFAGMLLGIIASVFLASILINAMGESFQIESMNITVALNQTQLENVIRDSPIYQTANAETQKHDWTGSDEDVEKINRIISKEYDRGFVAAMDSIQSNILFAGSTFKYGDNNTFVKAWDMSPGKAEIVIFQNGDEIDRGICFSNKWCTIGNVNFQIDDIHIGKEADYLVYWSDK